MAKNRDPLDSIFADIRDAARANRRSSLRRHAGQYRREVATLLYWTFPDSRPAVLHALAHPQDRDVTRALCRALWRDLQTAKGLPDYLCGRALRISSLRILFAGECMFYLRQRQLERERSRRRHRPLTTGDWLTGVCRAIESS